MTEVLPHWLTKQAALSPGKKAIELEDGTKITFSELQMRSRIFARQLAGLGVKEGSKVAVLSHNHLDMAVSIHALSYLQAVVVLLNTKLSAVEITDQLISSETMLLLTTDDLQQAKPVPFDVQKTFTDIKKLPDKEVKLTEEIELSTPFTMMFTSGTTGKPKIVVHTYGNHWWSAIGSTLNLGLHQHDKWLLTLPMYHVSGLSILMRSVITGMEVYLMNTYTPTTLFEAIKEKQITIVSIVSVMLKDLLDILKTERMPETVRCLLLGGSAVPEPLLKEVKQKSLPVFQSYGMTETSSQIVTLSAENALEKIGSSGKPLFPAQVEIGDKDETGVGEIAVKGPMVFGGYEQNPGANAKAYSNGWFKTGDLGYIDNDGFLFVLERRTDLIISGGENIYPGEIENVLLGIEGVVEAAVAAKTDEKWGKVPAAFVVTEQNSLTEAMVMTHLKSSLASYKLPKEVHFIKQLPRNATNKIMRHQLKEWL